MYELKTKLNDSSVEEFLNSFPEPKRKDCFTLLKLFKEVTAEEPKMWGTSIVGFGSYHYKYASGHEGDWLLTGFSPRKQNISLYFTCGLNSNSELMQKLGKHKTGKSCLYINKLDDINIDVLKELISGAVEGYKNNPEEKM